MRKYLLVFFVFLSLVLGLSYFLSTSVEKTIINPAISSVSSVNAQASEKRNILVLKTVSDDPKAQIKSLTEELDKMQNELNVVQNSTNADVNKINELKTKIDGLKAQINDLETQLKIDDVQARLKEGEIYIKVVDGCKVNVNASCLNARAGAGTKFKSLKRLRIGMVFPVKQAIKGDDGKVWFQIIPDPIRPNLYGKWFVIADYVEEISFRQIIPRASPGEPVKTIEVDLSDQVLKAYEGKDIVRGTKVSSGVKGRFTETLPGRYTILNYRPSAYMGGPRLSFDLPGVPFAIYFNSFGAALHGTYWHNEFGVRKSHSCVNLPTEEAMWLYNWVNLDTIITIKK